MYQLKIPNMTCGHCASVITKTVKTLDPNATLDIKLDSHHVNITSSCELNKITDALNAVDYPAQVLK